MRHRIEHVNGNRINEDFLLRKAWWYGITMRRSKISGLTLHVEGNANKIKLTFQGFSFSSSSSHPFSIAYPT